MQQTGPATLLKEEAACTMQKETGKTLTTRQLIISKLRTLDAASPEFYTTAAGYFRRRFRPNRTYALFFLFLGGFYVYILIVVPRLPLTFILVALGGYLFCGALGLPLFYHASATVRLLSKTHDGDDANSRIQRLRKVALNNQTDPISALVLEMTDLKQE
jgi:hypothetical protein